MAKNLVSGPIFAYLAQIQASKKIFPKIWLCQSLDIMVSNHHVISEKTNNPILRKLSDGWTSRRVDESDFIGRCQTDVERQKIQEK